MPQRICVMLQIELPIWDYGLGGIELWTRKWLWGQPSKDLLQTILLPALPAL